MSQIYFLWSKTSKLEPNVRTNWELWSNGDESLSLFKPKRFLRISWSAWMLASSDTKNAEDTRGCITLLDHGRKQVDCQLYSLAIHAAILPFHFEGGCRCGRQNRGLGSAHQSRASIGVVAFCFSTSISRDGEYLTSLCTCRLFKASADPFGVNSSDEYHCLHTCRGLPSPAVQ